MGGSRQGASGPSPLRELTSHQLYQDCGHITDTQSLVACNNHFITHVHSVGQEAGQDTAGQLVSAPLCLGPQPERLED